MHLDEASLLLKIVIAISALGICSCKIEYGNEKSHWSLEIGGKANEVQFEFCQTTFHYTVAEVPEEAQKRLPSQTCKQNETSLEKKCGCKLVKEPHLSIRCDKPKITSGTNEDENSLSMICPSNLALTYGSTPCVCNGGSDEKTEHHKLTREDTTSNVVSVFLYCLLAGSLALNLIFAWRNFAARKGTERLENENSERAFVVSAARTAPQEDLYATVQEKEPKAPNAGGDVYAVVEKKQKDEKNEKKENPNPESVQHENSLFVQNEGLYQEI